MNLKRQVFKNTFVQIFTYGLGLGIGLATTMILSRYLGAYGFGQFNYVFAFFYFFISLNDFGLNSIIIREVSQHPEQKEEILGSMLGFKIFMGILSLGISWAVIANLSLPQELKQSLFLYALILPALAFQVPSLIFNVTLKLEIPSYVNLFSKTFSFLLLLTGVFLKVKLFWIVFVFLVQETTTSLVLFWVSRRWVRPSFKFNPGLWKKMLGSSCILGVSGLLAASINRIDFLLLEKMRDLREVGFYAANYKITNLLEAFPLMLMNSLYPLMSQYAKTDLPRLKRLYTKSIFLLHGIGLAAGIMVSIFAEDIMRLICGPEFAGAGQGLRYLIWATVFLYGALSGGNLMISWHQERLSLLMTAVAAGLNLLFNFYAIPRWGYLGAAASTSLSYFCLWCFVMVFVQRQFKNNLAWNS